jgi:hypothetical protein
MYESLTVPPRTLLPQRNLGTQRETKTTGAVDLLTQEKAFQYSRIDVETWLLYFPRFSAE